MTSKKEWVVTMGGDRPIDEIARDIADAGLQDAQVLREIGSIIGSAGDDVAAKLRKVRGVVDVSPSTSVDVGPPDSSETW